MQWIKVSIRLYLDNDVSIVVVFSLAANREQCLYWCWYGYWLRHLRDEGLISLSVTDSLHHCRFRLHGSTNRKIVGK